jgi:hypothetical protein
MNVNNNVCIFSLLQVKNKACVGLQSCIYSWAVHTVANRNDNCLAQIALFSLFFAI